MALYYYKTLYIHIWFKQISSVYRFDDAVTLINPGDNYVDNTLCFEYSPTFGLSTLLGHDTYDHGIADDDGDERKEVDGEDVEEIVVKLMSSRWKEVERDTLCEPREHRMMFFMEYYALEHIIKQRLTHGCFKTKYYQWNVDSCCSWNITLWKESIAHKA